MNLNEFQVDSSSEKFELEVADNSSLAFSHDTTSKLIDLIDCYERDGEAQVISFRELVSWVKVGERATHYIHPYPAKLLPQIAHFFLAAKGYFGKGLNVLDPFGGTGTVALEAILSGNRAFYADANPLARLIAKVKTTSLCSRALLLEVSAINSRYKRSRSNKAPDVVNITRWYDEQAIRDLTRLKSAIEGCSCEDVKDFFLVVFSAVSRKVSTADPRLSVPVKRKDLNSYQRPSVLSCFLQQAEVSIQRMQAYLAFGQAEASAKCVGFDARKLKSEGSWREESSEYLASESIDLVITSPPYAGAQKYIRASSLSLGWLGLAKSSELKGLENRNIGREHLPKAEWILSTPTSVDAANIVIEKVREINPIRAAIASTYLNEMEGALRESSRVLREGGHLVLVIGNNEVCGENFASSEYLVTIAERCGLIPVLKAVDEIKSRGLMTKRNKTAGVISREWVILFRKSSAWKM